MTVITKEILAVVHEHYKLNLKGIHGVAHWSRVRYNGLLIAKSNPEVDATVVELFAFLHDSCREVDGPDIMHGPRARLMVRDLGNEFLKINYEQFMLLQGAIDGHTSTIKSGNPTIAACWDADRLDLWRCGTKPDAQYLNHEISQHLIGDAMNRSQHWVSKKVISFAMGL